MNHTRVPEIFDIAIAGGGIVGLVLARLLGTGLQQAGMQRSVALLEPHPPQAVAPDADIDLRVSALSPASRAVLQNAGIWQLLPANKVCAYEKMCVWQAGTAIAGTHSIHFSAAELGEADLGHVIENRAIRQAAWQQAVAAGTHVFSASPAASIVEHPDYCTIAFENGEQLHARLVVGADGVHSRVRAQMGVAFREWSHAQSAVVAHVTTEKPHAATAWQSFLPAGPVALLPLADGRSSLVWSCPAAQAQELLEMDVAAFDRELTAALAGVLGEVHCTTARVSFPLATGYAERYTGRRFALLGDAAHRVHPLAGQGVNLGLLDAASLAETLLAHLILDAADPGDPLALRRYERNRKGENLLALGTLDAINRAFSGPARDIAGRGLGLVDRLTPLKARLARYAMGRGLGTLPAASRPSGPYK
jgi:ubiquinone biosynthesis UbiH/UbiF/VisC/COQ6 family hydroxylase